MKQVNPYITFNGNCREAMTFYQSCFGGQLTLQTVAETPMAAQCPTGMQHQIIHSQLVNKPFVIMGTDMTQPEGYLRGNSMAVSVNCNSEEEINSLFNSLADGGKVIDPLKVQFWGDHFGVVADKYGVCWMLNYGQSHEHKDTEEVANAQSHNL